MKSRKIMFITILSTLVCFGILPGAQAEGPAAPDTALAGGNTADGQLALAGLTTGIYNSAFGIYALLSNADANFNTGVGGVALILNTASENTAVGAGTLLSNTTAGDNTAVGAFAMFTNASGADNTAVGGRALQSNVSAVTNAAVGTFALQNNDSGGAGTADFNTAVGGFALKANVDGTRNTAVGAGAIESGDGGNDNTAVGELAGLNITGNSNTCLGSSAGSNQTNGEAGIYIGAQVQAGTPGEFEFIRIGNDTAFTFPYDTYIAGIFARSNDPGTATTCFVDANGKVASVFSSRRYKHDIEPMENASEAILALRPVSFHYNSDAKNTPCFGLIAEEVAAVNRDLVIRDKTGEPMTVRYDQINAMLLNEFLKEHKKVEEQQASITELKSTVAQQQKGMEGLTAQLKAQAAQIQKVSAQLEVSKPAPQVVVNKP
jgi:uncharacterized coiled-coil protein SlyX